MTPEADDTGDIALSDLQLDLMRVLWRGEASVAAVSPPAGRDGSSSTARSSTNRRSAAAWSAG
jgi:hypothetical protein